MRFLADMGISPVVIEVLQHRGHQATHLYQEGLSRSDDSEILKKARNEGSILLTHDLGFGDLLAASGAGLPSVIIFRLRNMRPENVAHYLLRTMSQHKEALTRGAIVTITEGQTRIRVLPLRSGQ